MYYSQNQVRCAAETISVALTCLQMRVLLVSYISIIQKWPRSNDQHHEAPSDIMNQFPRTRPHKQLQPEHFTHSRAINHIAVRPSARIVIEKLPKYSSSSTPQSLQPLSAVNSQTRPPPPPVLDQQSTPLQQQQERAYAPAPHESCATAVSKHCWQHAEQCNAILAVLQPFHNEPNKCHPHSLKKKPLP